MGIHLRLGRHLFTQPRHLRQSQFHPARIEQQMTPTHQHDETFACRAHVEAQSARPLALQTFFGQPAPVCAGGMNLDRHLGRLVATPHGHRTRQSALQLGAKDGLTLGKPRRGLPQTLHLEPASHLQHGHPDMTPLP